MNNYERIKNLNIDEISKLLGDLADNLESCIYCPIDEFCSDFNGTGLCKDVFRAWLESETE